MALPRDFKIRTERILVQHREETDRLWQDLTIHDSVACAKTYIEGTNMEGQFRLARVSDSIRVESVVRRVASVITTEPSAETTSEDAGPDTVSAETTAEDAFSGSDSAETTSEVTDQPPARRSRRSSPAATPVPESAIDSA